MLRLQDGGTRVIAQGQIDFSCIPALLDVDVERLLAAWEVLGKRFSIGQPALLRNAVGRGLNRHRLAVVRRLPTRDVDLPNVKSAGPGAGALLKLLSGQSDVRLAVT